MKICILGAGFSGLTAAHELIKKGHEVWVFEKNALPGGAAGGFKEPQWEWYVDYAYHHWFTNDSDILDLCKEIGFTDILTVTPETASLYGQQPTRNNKPITYNLKPETGSKFFEQLFGSSVQGYKLDTPLDLLKFDRLSLFDRIRTGIVLAFLKFGPALPFYHTMTAADFLKRTMGEVSYNTLWKPLFTKKFGEYANKINTMFFWARIKKRTQALMYPGGGFQELANYFSGYLIRKGVNIVYNAEITELRQIPNNKFQITNKSQIPNSNENLKLKTKNLDFDAVVNTLPSPIFLRLEKNVLPEKYRKQLSKIEYIGAQTVIFETEEKILPKTYWLNIADMSSPWMVAIQHTNFMDKKHFNNKHIFYLAKYGNTKLTINPKLEARNTKQILNSKFETKKSLENSDLFRDSDFGFRVCSQKDFFLPMAQPLYTTEFSKIVPQHKTPVPNLYFANMEQTYPYDRGTNYAVKVGKEVATKLT